MLVLFWAVVFVGALLVLVKGADWLVASAEKFGLAFGLSPFIVGVTIVAVGTSFPELVSSFVAAWQGIPEVVAANAVGSNIANILLIVGAAAVVARKLIVTKSLIDVDLPLLAIGTALFLGVAWDAQITLGESILMLAVYGIYLAYTIMHRDQDDIDDDTQTLPTRHERRQQDAAALAPAPHVHFMDYVLLVAGVAGLTLGAKYLIDALVALSTLLNIGVGVITITAVAVGTSLPELLVSVKAAYQKKSEVALGNIFGSNVFNALVVVGLPGLFFHLPVDEKTFAIGLPAMAVATFLFVISGISRRIYIWEGAFFLALYILFVAKLFNWF